MVQYYSFLTGNRIRSVHIKPRFLGGDANLVAGKLAQSETGGDEGVSLPEYSAFDWLYVSILCHTDE